MFKFLEGRKTYMAGWALVFLAVGTLIQNWAAGQPLSDVQTGFRLYTRPLVEATGFPETPLDPGRALVTGIVDDPTLEHVNAFKISPLRGIRHTAPYFHDNSARTLEDVAAHYAKFFNVASGGLIVLTKQDERDIVAFLKLLD